MGEYAEMELNRQIFGDDDLPYTPAYKRQYIGKHECLICDRGFKTAKGLAAHQEAKSHTDKRVECGVCGRRFVSTPACDDHMRDSHGFTKQEPPTVKDR